jgi:MFS family permease
MAFTTTRYLLPIILPQMAFELKSTISEMGLLASAYFATYTFSTIFWGRLSDKIGAVRVISLCCVLCMTSFIFTGLSPSLYHALSSYAIAGVGAGGLYVPLNALLTRWFRRRGTAIGITTTGATLAGLFLGVVVPFLAPLYGWRIVWIILGLPYLVLAVVSARFLKESPTTCDKARASEHAYREPSMKWLLRDGLTWHLGAIYLLWGFGVHAFLTYMVAYLSWCGLSTVESGFIYSIYSVAGLTTPLWGALSDRISKRHVFSALCWLSSFSVLAFVVVTSYALRCFTAFLVGSALGGFAVYAAMVGDYYDKALYGTAFGLLTLFLGIGMTLGPALGGYVIATSKSMGNAILLSALGYGLAGILAIIVGRRRSAPRL